MKYTELGKLAQADLNMLMSWIEKSGQGSHIDKLRRAVGSQTDIIETHIFMGLRDVDYTEATPYIKRVVGWMMVYVDDIKHDADTAEYSRDRAARLKSEKLSLPDDMVSSRTYATIPVEIQDWWEGMTPEERGDWIASHHEAE